MLDQVLQIDYENIQNEAEVVLDVGSNTRVEFKLNLIWEKGLTLNQVLFLYESG